MEIRREGEKLFAVQEMKENKKNSSNCMTILFCVDTVSSSNGFQICIWFQKIYYASAGPRKTHPMVGHRPRWCAIYCWPMVPVPSWKKIYGRRWGCLLLPVWWPCMGAFDQERYRMGRGGHPPWRLTSLQWTNLFCIFKQTNLNTLWYWTIFSFLIIQQR